MLDIKSVFDNILYFKLLYNLRKRDISKKIIN